MLKITLAEIIIIIKKKRVKFLLEKTERLCIFGRGNACPEKNKGKTRSRRKAKRRLNTRLYKKWKLTCFDLRINIAFQIPEV